jgi:hypothetical protein
MTQEGEPGRSVPPAFGAVVCCRNSADHILVDIEAKGLGQVLSDLRTAKTGIALLEFTDGSDRFRGGSFWTWLLPRTRRIEESIFQIPEPTMKAQQGGGLQDDGGAQEPTRPQELRKEPKENTVGGAEIGRSPPRTPYHQKLLLEEEILREHGPDPPTSQNSDQTGQQA